MTEQMKAIKDGKSISKPIYNHVTGNLDDPEEIQPTPIFVRPLNPSPSPRNCTLHTAAPSLRRARLNAQSGRLLSPQLDSAASARLGVRARGLNQRQTRRDAEA